MNVVIVMTFGALFGIALLFVIRNDGKDRWE